MVANTFLKVVIEKIQSAKLKRRLWLPVQQSMLTNLSVSLKSFHRDCYDLELTGETIKVNGIFGPGEENSSSVLLNFITLTVWVITMQMKTVLTALLVPSYTGPTEMF